MDSVEYAVRTEAFRFSWRQYRGSNRDGRRRWHLDKRVDDGIVVVHSAQWSALVRLTGAPQSNGCAGASTLRGSFRETLGAARSARRSGAFDVRMVRLDTGDYLIDDEVLIQRKTTGDFVASLVDGRLFPQTARLAHGRDRSLLIIEGPRPTSMPDVHSPAIEGAIVSLAAMWRLPVLHSSEPEHSVFILRLLADQVTRFHPPVLRRSVGSRSGTPQSGCSYSRDFQRGSRCRVPTASSLRIH